MEMDSRTLILLILCSYLMVAFIGGIIGAILWDYRKNISKVFRSIFMPKDEIVKGRVIGLRTKKFPFLYSDFNSPNVSLITPIDGVAMEITKYIVFLEDDTEHKKRSIEISKNSYEELEEKKKSLGIKNKISFYYKKYFFIDPIFDHLEYQN